MNTSATRLAIAAGIAVLLLSGCDSEDAEQVSATSANAIPTKSTYYAYLALPSVRPEGLSFVRVEQFADPTVDGQRVQLIFGNESGGDTVYLCTRPSDGTPTGGTACPYPGKDLLRVVNSGTEVETVYALDTQDSQTESKAGSASARDTISDALADAATEQSPSWFTDMANEGAQ